MPPVRLVRMPPGTDDPIRNCFHRCCQTQVETRASGRQRRINEVPRAGDVHIEHRGLVGHPELVAGGRVETPVAAAQRLRELLLIIDVAHHPLPLHALQSAHIAPCPHQALHPMAARHQLTHQVPADEPRRARDKTFHGRSL